MSALGEAVVLSSLNVFLEGKAVFVGIRESPVGLVCWLCMQSVLREFVQLCAQSSSCPVLSRVLG